MPNHRKHIQIRGVVQGVGFRPLVYNLAHSLGLSGYVLNSSSGVTIEVEGDGAAVASFLKTLQEDPPPLAEITEITVSALAVAGSAGFSILGSREEAGEFALVSPDAGTCDACWRDFGDPGRDGPALGCHFPNSVRYQFRYSKANVGAMLSTRRRRTSATWSKVSNTGYGFQSYRDRIASSLFTSN